YIYLTMIPEMSDKFWTPYLAGRGDWRCLNPGVSLRSAPGCVLVAPLGRIHPERILSRQGTFCPDNNVV
ncbi:hypothetical protein, partial [Xylanibacter rodentium]|uniref:hypothetical protein n=1 Tax=Xylanibacter rodentium TaxID=2736289 RepID=UPI00258B10F5